MLDRSRNAGIALASCLVLASTAAAQTRVVTTPTHSTPPDEAIGAHYRRQVQQAFEAMYRDHDLARAEELLGPVLAYCDAQQRPGRITISVDDAAQYARYVAEHGDGTPVEWIDYACPSAYKASAYRLVEMRDYQGALALLEKSIAMAPYRPESHSERGFVLNQLGKPADGLASYRKAHALAGEFGHSPGVTGVALRGIGYSLVELGDLDAARQAYERSLEVDPGNTTALNELEYIRQRQTPPVAPAGASGSGSGNG